MGGENLTYGLYPSISAGSSPRGRGKLNAVPDAGDDLRLIPAWAGKTIVAVMRIVSSPAHPRVGGENSAKMPTDDVGMGSSPRGRGKRAGKVGISLDAGLIPAWAGKTH